MSSQTVEANELAVVLEAQPNGVQAQQQLELPHVSWAQLGHHSSFTPGICGEDKLNRQRRITASPRPTYVNAEVELGKKGLPRGHKAMQQRQQRETVGSQSSKTYCCSSPGAAGIDTSSGCCGSSVLQPSSLRNKQTPLYQGSVRRSSSAGGQPKEGRRDGLPHLSQESQVNACAVSGSRRPTYRELGFCQTAAACCSAEGTSDVESGSFKRSARKFYLHCINKGAKKGTLPSALTQHGMLAPSSDPPLEARESLPSSPGWHEKPAAPFFSDGEQVNTFENAEGAFHDEKTGDPVFALKVPCSQSVPLCGDCTLEQKAQKAFWPRRSRSGIWLRSSKKAIKAFSNLSTKCRKLLKHSSFEISSSTEKPLPTPQQQSVGISPCCSHCREQVTPQIFPVQRSRSLRSLFEDAGRRACRTMLHRWVKSTLRTPTAES